MANISVQFYNNLSDNRCMEKVLVPVGSPVPCDIYKSTDVMNPTLLVDTDKIDITGCNYCIISGFARNYFIRSIVPTSAKRVQVACHVDVLSTYKDEIRNCPIIAARSTNNVNYYLEDTMRLFNVYSKNQYLYINGTESDSDLGVPSNLILITA